MNRPVNQGMGCSSSGSMPSKSPGMTSRRITVRAPMITAAAPEPRQTAKKATYSQWVMESLRGSDGQDGARRERARFFSTDAGGE